MHGQNNIKFVQEISTTEAGQKILRLVWSYWLRTGLIIFDVKRGGLWELCWMARTWWLLCDLPSALWPCADFILSEEITFFLCSELWPRL